MRHNWKKDKNGNVDEWAWDTGYHNGVYCVNCGKTVCVNCTPDYMALDDCTGSEANIVTNADRIRAMSDEELAILLCRIMDCSICKRNIQKDGECDNYSADGLSKAVLNWLQRPVEEDT